MTARQELFVPKGDACELDRVTVCNGSTIVKELDLFSYVEFCLWDAVDDGSNFQRNFSTGEVEVEGSVIYHKTEYRERRDHYAVFWANCPVDSFDTTRDAFCGVYGGPADPQAVRAGHCSGSIAHGWAPVGALHIHLTLAPGESRSILFGLGYIENPQQEKFIAPGVINKTRAHAMMERYATDAQVDAARAGEHGFDEFLVTRHVHHAGTAAVGEVEPREAELDGESPPLLLRQTVGVHAGEGADQRRFSVVDVTGGADDDVLHRSLSATARTSSSYSSGRRVRRQSSSRSCAMRATTGVSRCRRRSGS